MTLTDITKTVSNGVTPTRTVPLAGADGSRMIMADSNALAETERLMREVDDRRLLDGLGDTRFAGEAVRLAREAFEVYDPKVHRLSAEGADQRQPNEISFGMFFRMVAFDTYRRTRNPGLAAKVLMKMVKEATS